MAAAATAALKGILLPPDARVFCPAPGLLLQELFQRLILAPHWASKHAAFEALLQLLRHGDLGSGIMTLLPPALKLSATSAVPEVVTTVRVHLQKQPEPQVCFGAVLSTPARLCGRGLCKRG